MNKWANERKQKLKMMWKRNKENKLKLRNKELKNWTNHQPHCPSSTIDSIASKTTDSPHSITHFGCPEIVYHDFIGGSFEIGHLRQPMTYTRRSFGNIDRSTLLSMAACWPWDSIYNLADANLKVLRLNSFLVALLDQFAPFWTYARRVANSLIWLDDNFWCGIGF
jgi:hypothetical protein